MARRSTRHPVTVHLPFSDDRQMAEYWGREVASAIKAAVANPHPTTAWDHDLEQAVRSAKMAAWRAGKVKGKRWHIP